MPSSPLPGAGSVSEQSYGDRAGVLRDLGLFRALNLFHVRVSTVPARRGGPKYVAGLHLKRHNLPSVVVLCYK